MLKSKALNITYTILLLFILTLTGCNENDSVTGTYGVLMNYGDCKNFSADEVITTPSNQECFDFEYDDGTLYINHYNASFNCCPSRITAEFIITANSITINENEVDGFCDCICLYDLEYRIYNIEPQQYDIIFNNIYVTQADPLAGFIDLTIKFNGGGCIQRDFYPWGIQ